MCISPALNLAGGTGEYCTWMERQQSAVLSHKLQFRRELQEIARHCSQYCGDLTFWKLYGQQ